MPEDAMGVPVTDMMEMLLQTPSNTDQDDVVRSFITLARQHIQQARPSHALQAVVMAMKAKGGHGAVFQVLNHTRELYRNKIQATAVADEFASLSAECAVAEALPLKSEESERSTVGPSAECAIAEALPLRSEASECSTVGPSAECAIAEALPLRSEESEHSMVSPSAECAIVEAPLPLKSEESEHSMAGLSRESVAHGNSILAESGRSQIVLDAFSDGASFVCLKCGGLVSSSRKDEHDAYWCC